MKSLKRPKTPIRIMMVDDHPVVQSGVRRELSKHRNIIVVGQAQSGEEALKLARTCDPDVILMDVSMPGLTGAEVVRQMHLRKKKYKVLIYTVHNDRGYILEFARLGVSGYVNKTVPLVDLVAAIEKVFAGEKYFPGFATQAILDDYLESKTPASSTSEPILTIREIQILRSVAQGNNNKKIAAELGLSSRTVESHRDNIKSKLGLKSTAELTRYALRKGLISD